MKVGICDDDDPARLMVSGQLKARPMILEATQKSKTKMN